MGLEAAMVERLAPLHPFGGEVDFNRLPSRGDFLIGSNFSWAEPKNNNLQAWLNAFVHLLLNFLFVFCIGARIFSINGFENGS